MRIVAPTKQNLFLRLYAERRSSATAEIGSLLKASFACVLYAVRHLRNAVAKKVAPLLSKLCLRHLRLQAFLVVSRPLVILSEA